jgi:hypothetical protein
VRALLLKRQLALVVQHLVGEHEVPRLDVVKVPGGAAAPQGLVVIRDVEPRQACARASRQAQDAYGQHSAAGQGAPHWAAALSSFFSTCLSGVCPTSTAWRMQSGGVVPEVWPKTLTVIGWSSAGGVQGCALYRPGRLGTACKLQLCLETTRAQSVAHGAGMQQGTGLAHGLWIGDLVGPKWRAASQPLFTFPGCSPRSMTVPFNALGLHSGYDIF